MGVWAIATAALVRSICGGALLVSLVPGAIVRPRVSLSRTRHMLGFGMRFQAVGGVNLVRDQGLNVAVAAIAGVATLGVWSVAFRLVQATTLLFESLWRVSFPAMARLLETGEDPRPLLERGIALTGTAAGFLVAAMGGSATALVPVLFGESWSSAADVRLGPPWASVSPDRCPRAQRAICMQLAMHGPRFARQLHTPSSGSLSPYRCSRHLDSRRSAWMVTRVRS